MTRLVVRTLIVPIGIGFAAVAALITGLAGAVGWGYGASLASLVAATGASIVLAAATGADPNDIGAFLSLLVLVAFGILFLPIILVALVGEIFGIGAWMPYAFGTGAAFTAVPILFPGDPAAHGWPANATLGFFATGLVAGTVYWLIAGRGAARPQPASAGIDHA